MNTEQLGGFVRTILLAGIAYASGKGVDMTFLGSPEIQAALVTIVVGAWSWWSKRETAK